jgi:hypothetical protein
VDEFLHDCKENAFVANASFGLRPLSRLDYTRMLVEKHSHDLLLSAISVHSGHWRIITVTLIEYLLIRITLEVTSS